MQIETKVESEFLAAIVQQSDVIEPDVLNSVEPEYFQVDSYQWLVRILKARDWKSIAFDYLDQELLSIRDVESRQKYRNQLYALYVRELTFVDDAADKFRAYISFCIVNVKIRSAFEGFNRTDRIDYLLKEVETGVGEARRVIQGVHLPTIDYAASYDDRQDRRRHIRDNPNLNPRLLTGILGLDQQFVIRAPMLVDFMAPFKRYKSIFLNAMGYSFLLQGHNVLHLTYENELSLTQDRYDSMFGELNYNRIANLLITEGEKSALDQMFAWMGTWHNRLKIIKCVPQQTTVKDVEEEIKFLYDKEGFIADVEVWDYLNIIAPSKKGEERLEQKQIVWDLKNHADKHDVAIIEASQSNMGGVKAERMDFTHRGLSTDISRGIDLCIAIDQSPEEKAENIVVLTPQYLRGGEITIPEVVLDTDFSRMTITRELYKLWNTAMKVNPYISGS